MLAFIVSGIEQNAATLPPSMKTMEEAKSKVITAMGTDPRVVAAVRAYNAAPPAGALSMTNEKWRNLSVLDPFVRSFSKGPLVDASRQWPTPPFASCSFRAGAFPFSTAQRGSD